MVAARRNRKGWRCHSAWLLLGMALTLVSTPAVAADEPAKTNVFVVAPGAFLPTSNAARYTVTEGGLGRLCTLGGSAYFIAAVRLPAGAVIERITARVTDTSDEGFGLLSLARRSGDTTKIMAMTGISTGSKQIEELSASDVNDAVVDPDHYAYVLQVMLSSPDVCLTEAHVEYRLP